MPRHALTVTEVVQMLFPLGRAASLAGVSDSIAARWVRTGLVRMDHPDVQLFSFRDLVALRTLAVLHTKHKVPLRGKRGLRAFARWLYARYHQPFASLRFSVAGREVLFDDGAGLVSHYPAGQVVDRSISSFDLRAVENALERQARASSHRSKEDLGKIDTKRRLIAGTRIPTAMIAELKASGATARQIVREFPSLREADVEAAVSFEKKRRVAA